MDPTTYNLLYEAIDALEKQQQHIKVLVGNIDMSKSTKEEDRRLEDLQTKISDLSHRLDVITQRRSQLRCKPHMYCERFFRGYDWTELSTFLRIHKVEE